MLFVRVEDILNVDFCKCLRTIIVKNRYGEKKVFSSLIPGPRYRFTSQDVTGKVILYFSLSNIICIKDLLKLSLISYSVAKIYGNSNHWAGLSLVEGP